MVKQTKIETKFPNTIIISSSMLLSFVDLMTSAARSIPHAVIFIFKPTRFTVIELVRHFLYRQTRKLFH